MKRRIVTFLTLLFVIFSTIFRTEITFAAKKGLSKQKAVMEVDSILDLKLFGVKGKAVWTTSNKSVVKVNGKGKLTAKRPGEAKIKATVSGKSYTCDVRVVDSNKNSSYHLEVPTEPLVVNRGDGDMLRASSRVSKVKVEFDEDEFTISAVVEKLKENNWKWGVAFFQIQDEDGVAVYEKDLYGVMSVGMKKRLEREISYKTAGMEKGKNYKLVFIDYEMPSQKTEETKKLLYDIEILPHDEDYYSGFSDLLRSKVKVSDVNLEMDGKNLDVSATVEKLEGGSSDIGEVYFQLIDESGVAVYETYLFSKMTVGEKKRVDTTVYQSSSKLQNGKKYKLKFVNHGYIPKSTDPSKQDITLILPSTPQFISYYVGTRLQSTVKVESITYSSDNTTLKFYLTLHKTFDSRGLGQSSPTMIGWKLYDMNNYVVKSGTVFGTSMSVGDKVKDEEETVYNLTKGKVYRLELLNVN